MVAFSLFLKRMAQNISWKKGEPSWQTQEQAEIDFAQFSKLLLKTDQAISLQIKQLKIYKLQTELAMECLTEIKRWLADDAGKEVDEIETEDVNLVVTTPAIAVMALEHLLTSPFGEKHARMFKNPKFNWEKTCARLKQEQKIYANVYKLMFTAAPK